ncbi:c-type cytochrome [Nisaea sp.]|uniref:c-type cytochrome n=1 Tax=Nisaea sp. TaxID=2024842 RepID=UPI003B524133
MNAETVRIVRAFGLAILLAVSLSPGTAGAVELGDPKAGEQLFKVCKSCHRMGEGARNGVGPHLNGIFGRAAGAIDDFNYSEGMIRAGSDGLVWDAESLDLYIENPKTFVSKTRMNFAGMPDPVERSHLLAYLRAFSDRPSDIPEAAPTSTPTDHALDPTILAIVGDPDYGEYLSGECLTCHQKSGASEGIPSITGWPKEDFVVAMHAYKREIRPHPVMRMIAGRLSDEEIAGLAAYFEGLD